MNFSLNDLASQIGLSAKNLIYLVLGVVGLYFVLGSPKRVYSRARKASRRVASTIRRAPLTRRVYKRTAARARRAYSRAYSRR